jgi:transposase
VVDAEAICEADTRPNMRFVPIKTIEQQGCLAVHRTRHLVVRQQTATISSIRARILPSSGSSRRWGGRGVEQRGTRGRIRSQSRGRRRVRRVGLVRQES